MSGIVPQEASLFNEEISVGEISLPNRGSPVNKLKSRVSAVSSGLNAITKMKMPGRNARDSFHKSTVTKNNEIVGLVTTQRQLASVNLDLDSPRLKQAMEKLGYARTDLEKKDLKHF